MRNFAEGLRSQLAPMLAVLVTLAVVIGLLPFASHYGEVNGLPQRAERWAEAYAERREAARAREAARLREAALARGAVDAGGPAVDDGAAVGEVASVGGPDAESFTETVLELDAPAAGPQADVLTIDLVVDGVTDDIADLLAVAPLQDGWFPTAYDPADEAFLYPDEIDLLAQLHIADHRQQAGVPTPDFTAHVKALFARDGKLYAAYDPASSLPVAEDESPVVYRRAFEYALHAREHEWAAVLRARLLQGDLQESVTP